MVKIVGVVSAINKAFILKKNLYTGKELKRSFDWYNFITPIRLLTIEFKGRK